MVGSAIVRALLHNDQKNLITLNRSELNLTEQAEVRAFLESEKPDQIYLAAAKVGETLAVKAANIGLKEVSVVVKGVGSGRESAIRGFVSKGVIITGIKDETPIPFNGPKPKKPRRV